MTWNASYRGADGGLKTVTIEASSRAEVFAELKKRGISAVRVDVADSKKSRATASVKGRFAFPGRQLPIRGILAAATVIALAVAAWFLFVRPLESPKAVRTNRLAKIADARPSAAPSSAAKPSPAKPAAALPEPSSKGVGAGVETAAAADTATNAPPSPKKKRVFETGSDQLIAMATGAPEGAMIPPLPAISAAETDEFIASLSKPIKIDDDDDDAVKEVKRRVQKLRSEIAAILAENPGKEIGDVLNEHRELSNDNAKIRAEIVTEIERILKEEGDEAGARKYRDTMNCALQQMGISEINMPVTEEERRAEQEAEGGEHQQQ